MEAEQENELTVVINKMLTPRLVAFFPQHPVIITIHTPYSEAFMIWHVISTFYKKNRIWKRKK